MVTKMVTNPSFATTDYHRSKRRVDTSCRIALHCVCDVRIKVHGCGNGRVSKPLLGNLWMHTVSQELGSVTVPEIVKSNSRQVLYSTYQVREFLSHAPGLLWFPVFSAANQRLRRLPNSNPQQGFSLLEF
jgi:hypothetical protein